MQAATESAAYRGLIGAELMFARLNVNGRQGTKSSLIYFSDVTVKIDAPSLSNDISCDAFPIQRELHFCNSHSVYFLKRVRVRVYTYLQRESIGVEL